MSAKHARAKVLGNIRAALGAKADDPVRANAAKQRLRAHSPNLVPARAKKPHAELVTLFADMLRGQGADVTRLKSTDDVPQALAQYLREKNLPAILRTGDDATIASLPWSKTPALELQKGRARGSDTVALSRASTAAAETGTMFLTSGPDNPTTLNFLPDTHVALIKASDIVGSYEDAWQRLRAIHGERTLPRTVNLISGPSRTADIEQTIIMGAHGPRRLCVMIVD